MDLCMSLLQITSVIITLLTGWAQVVVLMLPASVDRSADVAPLLLGHLSQPRVILLIKRSPRNTHTNTEKTCVASGARTAEVLLQCTKWTILLCCLAALITQASAPDQKPHSALWALIRSRSSRVKEGLIEEHLLFEWSVNNDAFC